MSHEISCTARFAFSVPISMIFRRFHRCCRPGIDAAVSVCIGMSSRREQAMATTRNPGWWYWLRQPLSVDRVSRTFLSRQTVMPPCGEVFQVWLERVHG